MPNTDAERIVRQGNMVIEETYRQEEFDKVDLEALRKMSDKELAKWQYLRTEKKERAEIILAKYEWQRRLTESQVKATKDAAWIGIAGAILGVLLGAFLTLAVPFLQKLIVDSRSQPITSEHQGNQDSHHNDAGNKTSSKEEAKPKSQAPVTGEIVPPAEKPP